MILIYTKHPQKALDFLMKIGEQLHKDGVTGVRIIKTKNIYNTRLEAPDEYWEILPIDNRTRGKKWKKSYVDLDISEKDLLTIVIPNKDYHLAERWEQPMILI